MPTSARTLREAGCVCARKHHRRRQGACPEARALCVRRHVSAQGSPESWQIGMQVGGLAASAHTPKSDLNTCISRRDIRRFFDGCNLRDEDIRCAGARAPHCQPYGAHRPYQVPGDVG